MKKLIAVLLLFSMGCSSAIDYTRKSIVAGLHAVNATTKILKEVDKAKIEAALNKARAGDPDGASADLDKWEAQYSKIEKAMDGVWVALKTASDAVTIAENTKQRGFNLGVLAADIFGALTNLARSLAEAGVKIPGLS